MKTKTTPAVSIVIPAYNEQNRLAETLQAVAAFCRAQAWNSEIIVVSDGSRDKTADTAASFRHSGIPLRILANRKNRGKGAAVRRGVAAARGDMILFTDADLSTPIEELEKLLKAVKQDADIAIASRALPASRITQHQPLYREIMGKTFNRFVQWVVLPGLHDTQCGFKLFKRTWARKVFLKQTICGFGFDVEILYIARRMGARIAEIPVVWKNNTETKISPLRHSIQMFLDVFRVRWRHSGTR